MGKSVGDGASKMELDSHADSPVTDANAHILEQTGRTVSVCGFTDELGKPLLVEVVHAAVVFDCPTTGNSYVMVLNNALHVPSLDCSLTNPFIMRLAGIVIDECPKFLAEVPSIAYHSLYFSEHDLRIPLALDGIVSYFPCRMPRGEELIDPSNFLALTPSGEKWNPHDVTYTSERPIIR